MWTPAQSINHIARSGSLPETVLTGHLKAELRAEFWAGQMVMIVGRSGAMKSFLALDLVASWGLSTLYFSGDMAIRTVGKRLCSWALQRPFESGQPVSTADRQKMDVLKNLHIVPGSPITGRSVQKHTDAFIMAYDRAPEVVVIDNLMDTEGGESDYAAQTQAMQELNAYARAYGSTVVVLHHATDKGQGNDPMRPPSKAQIKNGMTEKPEIVLGVAPQPTLEDDEVLLTIALLKQREGPCAADGSMSTKVKIDTKTGRVHV